METGSAARDFVRPTVALSMGGACMRAMRHNVARGLFTSPLLPWRALSCHVFKLCSTGERLRRIW